MRGWFFRGVHLLTQSHPNDPIHDSTRTLIYEQYYEPYLEALSQYA